MRIELSEDNSMSGPVTRTTTAPKTAHQYADERRESMRVALMFAKTLRMATGKSAVVRYAVAKDLTSSADADFIVEPFRKALSTPTPPGVIRAGLALWTPRSQRGLFYGEFTEHGLVDERFTEPDGIYLRIQSVGRIRQGFTGDHTPASVQLLAISIALDASRLLAPLEIAA